MPFIDRIIQCAYRSEYRRRIRRDDTIAQIDTGINVFVSAAHTLGAYSRAAEMCRPIIHIHRQCLLKARRLGFLRIAAEHRRREQFISCRIIQNKRVRRNQYSLLTALFSLFVAR